MTLFIVLNLHNKFSIPQKKKLSSHVSLLDNNINKLKTASHIIRNHNGKKS